MYVKIVGDIIFEIDFFGNNMFRKKFERAAKSSLKN